MSKDIEPTIQDVLSAINEFSTYVENNMVKKTDFDQEIASLKSDTNTIQTTMVTQNGLNQELDQIRGRLVQVVTKDYLDDKLADFRGEFIVQTNIIKKKKR